MRLPTIPLPLPSNGPPAGFGWEVCDASIESSTTAFKRDVDNRDKFLGQRRCVVCGAEDYLVRRCHIIMDETWKDLKKRSWIPSNAKESPLHEPRNGLLLCPNHRESFKKYDIFFRYYPDVRKFVLVDYSGGWKQLHGKAVALDINDRDAPFPSLFIIHEMRVRGFNPFQPIEPEMPKDVFWQDWIPSQLDSTSARFYHDKPPSKRMNERQQTSSRPTKSQRMTRAAPQKSPGKCKLELNDKVIEDILAATRAMPSWKACQMENTSWAGTAEENIQKYTSTIGVEESSEESSEDIDARLP